MVNQTTDLFPAATTSSFIEEGLMLDMALGQQMRLRSAIETAHFKGKTTKEWSKREYEAKIEELKEKLAPLQI